MKRTLLFIAGVLAFVTMMAQNSQVPDYLPFVETGKQWHVARTDFDAPTLHFDTYTMNEEVVKDGKTYLKMYRHEDLLDVVYDAGLLREEDRKVYLFDTDKQKEFLMFDYSLKTGDTYETYSYDEQKMMTYKVLSVGYYTEGPQVVRYVQEADSMTAQHRYLRKWVVQSDVEEDLCLEPKTWIEGVGSIEGPFANLYDARPVSSRDNLAYVNDLNGDLYLPFSFYDTLNRQAHGCNLPTDTENNMEENWHHRLTYELEGDRLHVYGKVFTQCGPNNYAYFYEEPTDDPLVHKIEFEIQEVQPMMDCMALRHTNFYVPGFDPNMNYIVVDNQGEEHPVINRTPQNEYHPFIEDGKLWVVKENSDWSADEWIKYYYFDGDTIVNGQKAKRMMCDSQNAGVEYVGAWYEQDKKVYFATGRQQFELLYDFTLSSGDSIHTPDGYVMAVDKVSGGIPGFKGTYYNFRLAQDGTVVERWLEGVGIDYWPGRNPYYEFDESSGVLLACGIGDEIIYCNSEVDDPYVMGARKGRFDFTHTIKTKPKAPIRREKSDACISSSEREVARPKVKAPISRAAEQSLYSEYNEQHLNINLAPIDDAYLVRITNETGIALYEKAVNAGSIVALNIDISAYAKGRYTVVVENSQETFTGEFETQTTAIEEVRNGKTEVGSSIYNLQGQRIGFLKKGLNIVNGRKVVVK